MDLNRLYNFFTTNMKKTLLLILGLVLTTSLFAGPVGKEEAKEKALAFLNGNVGTKDGVAKAPRHQQDLSLATTGDAYHVFNIGAGNGFVIVSGSDLTPDIIGYTDEGSFNPQSLPDNMKAWLQGYADQIEWVEKNGEPAASESVMRKAPADVKTPIAALTSTKWGQGAPYNYQVPSGCVTGCVATAMAQVLYYCNKKEGFPTGTTDGIAGYNDGRGHDVPACDALPAFDWANMQKTYTGLESKSASEAIAVATLMQYCGASVGMKYGASSSSNSMLVADALKTYFGFDHHLKNIYRGQYTNAEWEDIIYQELAAERPVLYSGDSSGGGHAFICDGYDADGYFHFNWGWRGDYNGYYLLSVVNPDKGGEGSGTSADGYTMNQDVVIGIQKSTGDMTPEDARVSVSKFTYRGASTVAKSASAVFYVDLYVKSELTFNQRMAFSIGIFDDSDNLVYRAGGYGTSDFTPGGHWSKDNDDFNLNLNLLADGKTYKVKLVSQLEGSSDWLPAFGSDDYYVKAEVEGTNVKFTTVSPDYILTASDVKLTTDGLADTPQTITAKIKNTGTSPYRSNLYLFASGTLVSGNGVNVEPGETVLASFSYKPTSTGMPTIKITTDEAGTNEIAISGTPSVTITTGGNDTPALTFSSLNDAFNLVTVSGVKKFLGMKAKGTITVTNTSGTNYVGQVCVLVKNSDNGVRFEDYQPLVVMAGKTANVSFEYDLDNAAHHYYGWIAYKHNSAWENVDGSATYSYYVASTITTYDANGVATEILPTTTTYTVPSTATAVDLRGLSGVVTSLDTESANPNCLYIADFAAFSGITKNWVNGTTAANVELTDGHDFYSPIDFTATKISYTREFSKGADGSGNGWSTIILPFDVDASTGGVKNGSTPIRWFTSSSDTDKDFWVYKFITDGKGTVKFDHAGNIMKANTPYLITMPSDHWGVEYKLTGTPITFEATDAVIKSNEKNTQSGFYYMFTGGSQKQSVTDAYVLNDVGNKFKTTASGTVPAFQAYFYPSSHNLQADALAIGFVGHDEATGIVELTTDNGQESADDAWYTINGVKLTGEPTEKGIYIYKGKKIAIK